jgi:hypothetical protein
VAADELREVVELAESEAHAQGCWTVEPVHVLIGLLAAEGEPAVASARAAFERVRSAPVRARPAPLRSRVPWSAGAQALIDSSGDRGALWARLRERGPLLVQSFLADMDAEVAHGR